MAPSVGRIEVAAPLPVEAALLVTQEARARVFTARPEGSSTSPRMHAFPLGAALEAASQQAFSQVFERVTVVRTREEARRYRLLIEPAVTELRFRYDEPGGLAFATAAVARARVRVTVATPETTVWEKTVTSPEQRSAPWVVKLDASKEVGEAASAALASAFRQLAQEVAAHAAVRQAVGR